MLYPFTCFVCDTPLKSADEACPNCGYKFDDIDDMFICPYKKQNVCTITENVCNIEEYGGCPTKNKFELENDDL